MRLASLAALSLIALSACNREVPIRADKVYTGGTIYTGVSADDRVEAVAVGEGLILYAGDMATAIKVAKDGATIINIGSGFMYPGFTDSHVHLGGVGQRELTLNLDQVRSVTELKAALASYREAHADVDRIIGRGWIETHWPEGRFPTAADLDEVISDIPVVLTRSDGHALVANTKALEAAGIVAETPVPDGGDILKTETGEPNGMFIDNAMMLMSSLFTNPGPDEMKRFVSTGLDVYASRGWTGLHNMSVDGLELEALGALSRENAITLRTYNAVTPDQIDAAIDRTPSGPLLTTRAVKTYMDGALGSRGALLFQPYSDAPENSGLTLNTREDTLALFQKALDGDVQVAIHAIGDKGNKLALDWMETAFAAKEEIGHEPRWRIEHAQLVRKQDQARFAELGVIASMQPSHAIGDLYFAPSRVGMDRLGSAYAWKDLQDQGVVIAGGSDAPVEVGDPIIEFYAASVRKSLDGFSAEGWHPEEALSRIDAMKLFTQNAAFARFAEEQLGTIEPGKYADFSVFDQDILTVADDALLATKPLMTVVNGNVVWKAEPTK